MTDVKTKTAAQMRATKEKEHPPPPPPEVFEPACTDRPEGACYQIGKLLGKGGFAICYNGQLLPSKQRFALKVVKSIMPAKMEQKVGHQSLSVFPNVLTICSFKPSFRFTQR
jgi:hypothetical protein